MKVCVAGYKGRLGSALVNFCGYSPLDCDIRRPDQVQDAIDTESPDIIINCAARTQVDDAEDNYEDFLITNGFAVNNFFSYMHSGGRLIHVSTDYVFDGKKGPYKETDNPIDQDWLGRVSEPVNKYGWSKYAGEVACYGMYGKTTIVRTTGLFGSGRDFANMFLNELQNHRQLNVIHTLFGNHTYIPDLAQMISELITLQSFPEIIHLASEDIVSRYDFALALANEFGLDSHLVNPVKSIPAWIAKRPTKGGLKVNAAKKLGITIPSTLSGIQSYRQDIGA
jgi:dTDP-4-dehydrorhamnose reductase